ncbi:MAG: hypothetical protein P8L23_04015 [Flavobacteriales bacterium]|nr:hypothetical protein [Flavobacteriales bacterium]
MIKILQKHLLVFLFISFISCNQNSEQIENNQAIIDSVSVALNSKNQELDQLNEIIEDKDSINNEYALYIQNIKNNLREIQQSESIVQNHRSNPEFFLSDSMDISAEILKMAELIKENQAMISKLNKGLSNSNNKNDIYKGQIVDLNEQVATSNREIFYLHEELESLDASFKELFDNYSEKVSALNELENEVDQVWYTFGSKAELLENKVVSKEGGFIGIGKVKKLNNELNTDYFTLASKKSTESIKLGVKNAQLITSHPISSYELAGDKVIEELKIIDKEKFWSNSKYLVIEVK